MKCQWKISSPWEKNIFHIFCPRKHQNCNYALLKIRKTRTRHLKAYRKWPKVYSKENCVSVFLIQIKENSKVIQINQGKENNKDKIRNE